jgi:hypothetical protein
MLTSKGTEARCFGPFERSLKRFLLIILGEAKEERVQLSEPEGRVLKSPEASPSMIKKRFRQSEKGLEHLASWQNTYTTPRVGPRFGGPIFVMPYYSHK